MMEELRECRFCGDAEHITIHNQSKNHYVECLNCGARGPTNSEKNCYDGKEKAIADWNLRPAENKELTLEENENFIQTKFGYCFYSLGACPFIYNLYVHPQYRRCGHSRMLLGLVISEIRKSGYEGEILIQANPREDSIGLADLTTFYKSKGLVVYEARKPGEVPNDK